MNSLLDLKDKVIVITGGYGHLGTGIALGLLKEGATVVVAGRDKNKFEEKFSSSQGGVYFQHCDIFSSESFRSLYSKVYENFSRIDVVINNAYSSKGNALEGISDEDWAVTMEGVLGSAYKSIREVAPYLKEQRAGKIINIASMYGVVSPDFDLYEGESCSEYTNPPHYGAAKAGLIQLTRYYAALLGPDNIQVNCITPGPFPNPAVQENVLFMERLRSRNPLKKIGRPEDLVGPVILLSSAGSDFITGQNIIVDGGWTIW